MFTVNTTIYINTKLLGGLENEYYMPSAYFSTFSISIFEWYYTTYYIDTIMIKKTKRFEIFLMKCKCLWPKIEQF